MRRGKGRATLRFTFRHGSIPLLANTDNSPRRASLAPERDRVAICALRRLRGHYVRLEGPLAAADPAKGDVSYVPQGYGH